MTLSFLSSENGLSRTPRCTVLHSRSRAQIHPGVSGAYAGGELNAVTGPKLNGPQTLHSLCLMLEQMATLPRPHTHASFTFDLARQYIGGCVCQFVYVCTFKSSDTEEIGCQMGSYIDFRISGRLCFSCKMVLQTTIEPSVLAQKEKYPASSLKCKRQRIGKTYDMTDAVWPTVIAVNTDAPELCTVMVMPVKTPPVLFLLSLPFVKHRKRGSADV